MRIGPLEIVLILIVVMLVLLAVRVVRGDRPAPVKDAGKGTKSSLEIPERQVEESTGKGYGLQRTGIVFVLIAILLVLSAMNLFKWVMMSFTWAFIALAVGFAILFVSRKR